MNNEVKQSIISEFNRLKEDKFYRQLLLNSQLELFNGEENIDIKLLELYNTFLIYYRREGLEDYLIIAKIFRRVAHKIYRSMLNKGLTPKNGKFLNII